MWPFDKEPVEPAEVKVSVRFYESGSSDYQFGGIATREHGVIQVVKSACDWYRKEYIKKHGCKFAVELTGISIDARPR